ncbi:hypothetical protein B4147_3011 [Bacillus wiedmannii]|uniref:Uncharacterized protein n=1 Tax=Bacillus wiedmannii TaxID=1890302 RepID=A0A0G8CDE4_9BACI|nr:hypothetical protein B4147_3011 [Bacillus wiedmannii]
MYLAQHIHPYFFSEYIHRCKKLCRNPFCISEVFRENFNFFFAAYVILLIGRLQQGCPHGTIAAVEVRNFDVNVCYTPGVVRSLVRSSLVLGWRRGRCARWFNARCHAVRSCFTAVFRCSAYTFRTVHGRSVVWLFFLFVYISSFSDRYSSMLIICLYQSEPAFSSTPTLWSMSYC